MTTSSSDTLGAAALGNPMTVLCACGHHLDEHDRIAQRFCAATRSGHLVRGCVCVVAASAPLDRHNGSGLVQ